MTLSAWRAAGLGSRRRPGPACKHIGGVSFDTEELRGNIENPIGAAQVPMGVAGPVLVHGQHAKGMFYIPMATSEGALIRSYERGMVALTRSGGVQTAILADENQIVPTFFFNDVASAAAFCAWIPQNIDAIRAVAETTTRHGKLTDVKCYQTGRQVLVNFGYFTGDAQGMNMLVKATDACLQVDPDELPDLELFRVQRHVLGEAAVRLPADARQGQARHSRGAADARSAEDVSALHGAGAVSTSGNRP